MNPLNYLTERKADELNKDFNEIGVRTENTEAFFVLTKIKK